jgi:hypothetical protein
MLAQPLHALHSAVPVILYVRAYVIIPCAEQGIQPAETLYKFLEQFFSHLKIFSNEKENQKTQHQQNNNFKS